MLMPLFNFAQIESKYNEMMADESISFEVYQGLLLDASNYLISNPINKDSKEYAAAFKVVSYWENNQETGLIIPVNSNFYKSLETKENQTVYTAGMFQYFLDQRLNQGVLLMGLKMPNQNIDDQTDYKKIKLAGAEAFLKKAEDTTNNIVLSKSASKYLDAMKKNRLEKML